MNRTLLVLLIFLSSLACSEVDPLEEDLQNKTNELTGVWVWVNTRYPTPFGAIFVSTLNAGVIYKVVFTGRNAEVFRQNHLVQRFSFDVRKGAGDEYFLDITSKEELEYSTIDMLGGKISFNGKELRLSYDTQTFKSEMLLNRIEIF